MWKTFRAEFKYMFKKRIRVVEYLILLLIPFIYGFLYMNAYWAPFKHADRLPIIVINKDTGVLGKEMAKDMEHKQIDAGNQVYDIHVKDASELYKDKTDDQIEEMVNSGKYSAAIVIPDTFTDSINQIKSDMHFDVIKMLATAKLQELITAATAGGSFDINAAKGWVLKEAFNPATQAAVSKMLDSFKLTNILKVIGNTFGETNTGAENPNNIIFYNDYKNSYLAGEMTNFGAGLKDLLVQIALTSGDNKLGSAVYDSIKSLLKDSSESNNSIIRHEPIGGNIDSYGKGLSPYFISIALWAGVLVMTFMIKNERHIKDVPTVRHYFGKWLVWMITGWAQATILLTAVTLQGVNLGINQWQLFFWGYFVVTVFASIVQAVAYSIRFGDIGEFAVVILLVLQLISSSGTFPVEMQNVIFKIVHPVAPFTYSIDGFREMLYNPDAWTIIENGLILLAFPAVVVPLSVFVNYRFDKKTVIKRKGVNVYQSYEIAVGDM